MMRREVPTWLHSRLKPSTTQERELTARIRRTQVAWLRAELARAIRMVRAGSDAQQTLPGLTPKSRAILAIEEVRRRYVTNPPTLPETADLGVAAAQRANKAAAAAIRSLTTEGQILGIESFTLTGDVGLVASWVESTAAEIKTLIPDAIERLQTVVVEGLTAGSRAETVAKRLAEQLGISDRKAAFLARDQIADINAKATQHDFERAGMTHYRWLTSEDERVRPDHAVLNETVHTWDQPPIVDQRTGRRAHPGRDFNCRCVALPIETPSPGRGFRASVTA